MAAMRRSPANSGGTAGRRTEQRCGDAPHHGGGAAIGRKERRCGEAPHRGGEAPQTKAGMRLDAAKSAEAPYHGGGTPRRGAQHGCVAPGAAILTGLISLAGQSPPWATGQPMSSLSIELFSLWLFYKLYCIILFSLQEPESFLD